MALSGGRRLTVLIGISPPPILTGHPHCLRRFYHARTVAGRKYHYPSVCVAALNATNIYSLHGIERSHLTFIQSITAWILRLWSGWCRTGGLGVPAI